MKPPRPAEDCAASTRAWWARPGVVYFIGAGDPVVAIKIGMAAQMTNADLAATLRRRLSQIQSSNHERICLLGLRVFEQGGYPTRDAEGLERELHLQFASEQRGPAGTRGAEWFSPSWVTGSEHVKRAESSVVLPVIAGQRTIHSRRRRWFRILGSDMVAFDA